MHDLRILHIVLQNMNQIECPSVLPLVFLLLLLLNSRSDLEMLQIDAWPRGGFTSAVVVIARAYVIARVLML